MHTSNSKIGRPWLAELCASQADLPPAVAEEGCGHQDIEAATIRLENSRAALFLAAGTDDGLWPAAYSSERVQSRLKRLGFDRAVVVELHPTGHLIMGSGWAPTTQFQRSTGWLPGGNAELDSKAQRAVWPAFLEFLKNALND